MSLLDGLLLAAADHHPDNFKHFRKDIPEEWIQQTLAATGTATVRRRRLPAEQVVWLVISPTTRSDLWLSAAAADVIVGVDDEVDVDGNGDVEQDEVL